MNWQILISIIPVAVGVFLGAFAREIGVFLQINREDKRILKRVLFHQLNLWSELWRSDFSFVLSLFSEEFGAALLRQGATPEQTTGLFDSVKPQIIALLSEAKVASPQKLFEQYRQVVKQLAEVEPITAYQINFRFSGELKEKISEMVNRAVEMEDATDKPPTDKIIIDRLFAHLVETSNRELIARLEGDLLRVAKLIGWRTRRNAERDIKDMSSYIRLDVQQIVEQMIAQLMHLMAEGQQTPEQPTQP